MEKVFFDSLSGGFIPGNPQWFLNITIDNSRGYDKMTAVSNDESFASDAIEETVKIFDQVSEYGSLITDSLYFIIVGILAIFILHKIASKFLYPYLNSTRLIKVAFGTLYVLILVVAVLMTLKGLGFDVKVMGKITILFVLVGAVVSFFLVPFLPRLPFKIVTWLKLMACWGLLIVYPHTIQPYRNLMAPWCLSPMHW